MAIYTKVGDSGGTSLFGTKKQRNKYDQRIVAYGTVDELNSQLGFSISLLKGNLKEVDGRLKEIQKTLFEIASELATAPRIKPPFSLDYERTRQLEGIIDRLEGSLPALGNFIFPGGNPAGASLHVARSICRRGEREIVKLAQKEKVNKNILVYINRLSDTLFMLAREVNRIEKSPEEIWKK